MLYWVLNTLPAMILFEGVKFGTLSLTGSKCVQEVIYLFKQIINPFKTEAVSI